MKRNLTSILILLAFMPAMVCHAQANKYAEAVASEFNAADASVQPGLPQIPVIAVPTCGAIDRDLSDGILKAGGMPVAVSSCIQDFPALRDAAAGFDGFILTDGLKAQVEAEVADSTKGCAGIFLLKSMIDRNVPIFGTSDLLKEINTGLRRQDEEYATMADFIHHAALYKEAKQLMGRIFTVDTHNDQPCQYKRGASIGLRQRNQVSLPKMVEGYLDATFIVNWLGQGELDRESADKAVAKCERIFDQIHEDAAKYADHCGIARTEAEARALKLQGKKALFIGLENGYGIGTDISRIKAYRDSRDMTYMTLCHTGDNEICHTSSEDSKAPEEGLTAFGKKVVRELNACGVLIDLSHANEATFWDVVKYSKAPFVCTHSGAKGVFDHNRNLTDDQLRALAAKGGVCQVYTVGSFMYPDGSKATIDNTMIDHLMHCIEVAGIDHVGIGTDFDGGSGSKGLNGSNDVINITVKLLERGLSPEDIEKVWGGNFFRVFGQVQKMARK